MKLALHRSIIFWSGLLVIAFVCWAWWDSARGFSWCQKGGYAASNESAAVSLDHSPSSTIPDFSRGRHPPDICGPLEFRAFPAPAFVRGNGMPRMFAYSDDRRGLNKAYHERLLDAMKSRPPQDWKLVVPHWLILLAVAAVWLGLLIWRARRRKRIITP